jgi:SAM-dependent methyltransferase
VTTSADAGERFAAALRAAEDRLRAEGLGGRRAFVALVRHLAGRLGLPPALWPEGPDAPPEARLHLVPLTGDLDLFGLAYERFFTDLFKGDRGQYFTPRPLVELMADLAGIRPGDRVLDPTCGSGGFLVAALARGADVDGIEVDPDLAGLARLNLALHGANPRGVRTEDFFRAEAEPVYDVVLANPPFSLPVDHPDALARSSLAEGRARVGSDVLFVEAALRWLRPGGRLVTVLPHGVLANASLAPLRVLIEERAVREAIVSLPEGVFRPFGGTPTRACVVALRKRPTLVTPMLAAVIRSPGFDVRRKRFKRSEPDELVALRLSLRGERSGLFPAAPFAGARRVDPPVWVPEEAFVDSGVRADTFRVGDVARVRPLRRVASGVPTSVVEFTDVDKGTGEVTGTRTRDGGDGIVLTPGDVLFGRMRPELNNVTRLPPPPEGFPPDVQGSGEWIALEPLGSADFLLLALRSSFARAQLPVTAGQTRPRIHADDVVGLELPDPGPAVRTRLDTLLASIYAERRRLRARLDTVTALYERFGRGELSADELEAEIAGLG